MIEPKNPDLSIARQCKLVGIRRSGFYAPSAGESEANLELMRLIDAEFMETPFYGSRRQMTRYLRRLGHAVNRKWVRRLNEVEGP
jgi:putative transposase